MSGRRRLVALAEIARSSPMILRVDPQQVTREAVEVEAPVDAAEAAQPGRTFRFGFERCSVPVLAEVHGGPGWAPGVRVPFVSLAVQRSLTWQTTVERSGARRIMWYDENPAFEEELEGEALLVLCGYDSVLEAYRAPLGVGLLHPRHLAEVSPSELGVDEGPPKGG